MIDLLNDKPLLQRAFAAVQGIPPGLRREQALQRFWESLSPAEQEQMQNEIEEVTAAIIEAFRPIAALVREWGQTAAEALRNFQAALTP